MTISIGERIFSILKSKHMQLKDLADKLQLTSGAVSNWKNRKTDPPAKFIVPIADLLGVSPMYLLTGIDEKSNVMPATSTLSDEEQKVLTVFQSLDIEGRVMMLSAGITEQRRMLQLEQSHDDVKKSLQ